ncbi:hypothetical protein [Photorhabdus sp. SF281]|uniref:hypothetical protein n=1 Tax=Photorhabdus sp. SF281 TaxID=3459527 RepID=UPI0040441009
MGRRWAGTLDSVSTCPCGARLINSVMDSYEKQEAVADRVVTPTNMAQQKHNLKMPEPKCIS